MQILFNDYRDIEKSKLVKLSLKGQPGFIIGRITDVRAYSGSKSETQAAAATLHIIKNFESYKQDLEIPGDAEQVNLQSDNVESIEVVDVDEL